MQEKNAECVGFEREVAELRKRLEETQESLREAQETLQAIRNGEVDALVRSTDQGEQIFVLKGAEQPYRNLIEEMNEGAILLSEDNIILYCNAGFAKMLKAPLDKVIGRDITSWVPASNITAFNQLLTTSKTDEGRHQLEIALQAKDGHLVPTHISVNLLTMDSLTVTSLVVVDLTKHMEEDLKRYTSNLEAVLRERTEQLKKSERLAAIGQTAGMVGHDIRNPLQSIVSEIYLARASLAVLPDSPEKRELLESVTTIEEQSIYIDKIVKDLQDFAKPLKPEFSEVDIKSMIISSLATVTVPVNVEASAVVEDGLPNLRLDPLLLRRIMVNLATNAIQAMPQGGRLQVRAFRRNGKAVIAVEDTGVGIPEKLKTNIFTPMFTTKSKGQGFGLAVVKRLVEAQGGTICFESKEGKGTAFIIEFQFPEQNDQQ